MKFERILIDDKKILDYVLNCNHEQGRNKAKVFKTALNIDKNHYQLLMDALEKATQQIAIPLEKSIWTKISIRFSDGKRRKKSHNT